MVDLVKIRKKAKKRAEEIAASISAGAAGEAAPQSAPEPFAQTSSAVDEPPAERSSQEERPERVPSMTNADRGEKTESAGAVVEIAGARSKLERFKERAGMRRETAAAVDDVMMVKELELLTFALAGEQYAVPIEHIVEIVPARSATRIPNADPTVVGIISLRGAIVTLLDVRRRLRHPPAGSGPDSRIIVVEQEDETVGFEVDRVLRVVKLAEIDIESQPVVHASEEAVAIKGVYRQSNALTILLDLDKLLA
jgi:purine-binding chemotaxis protein CheW